MNRIVIKLTEHGELDCVSCDTDCRIFILDENSNDEPLYELTEGIGKYTGVQFVHKMVGNNMASTYESTGPWLSPKIHLGDVK